MLYLWKKIPKHVLGSAKIFHLQNLHEGGKLLNMDVLQALRSLEGEEPFDCIFMDAPYNSIWNDRSWNI